MFEDGNPKPLVKVIVSDCLDFASNGLLWPKRAYTFLSVARCVLCGMDSLFLKTP